MVKFDTVKDKVKSLVSNRMALCTSPSPMDIGGMDFAGLAHYWEGSSGHAADESEGWIGAVWKE